METQEKQNIDLGENSKQIESNSDVIHFSKDQRYPLEHEPICVICSRYGEYICDVTEKDVCSIECRDKVRCSMNTSKELSCHELQQNPYDNSIEKPSQDVLLTKQKVYMLRNELEISVEGENVPNPFISFEVPDISLELLHNMQIEGYNFPTPIQMQVVPIALGGRDILACAPTGSGKTASFLIPIICTAIKTRCEQSVMDPIVIILTPTRELAIQIENQIKAFVKGIPNMKTALLVGAMPMPSQIYRIRSGIQIIVATTGRFLEILKTMEDLSLERVKCLVVDEVDTMLGMGFLSDIEVIRASLPRFVQTLFFSATIPPRIRTLADAMLHSTRVVVTVGKAMSGTVPSSVSQKFLWIEEKSKKNRLLSIIKDSRLFHPPMVVFVESRLGAEMLAEALSASCSLGVKAIHGDKPQKERLSILKEFLEGEFPIVVATALLGRGLDLLAVKQIVNFDMPQNIENYIHQIGRAGKLGEEGSSITFINNSNKNIFPKLLDFMQHNKLTIPQEMINSMFPNRQTNKRKFHDESKQAYFIHDSNTSEFSRSETSWKAWKSSGF